MIDEQRPDVVMVDMTLDTSEIAMVTVDAGRLRRARLDPRDHGRPGAADERAAACAGASTRPSASPAACTSAAACATAWPRSRRLALGLRAQGDPHPPAGDQQRPTPRSRDGA